MERIAIYTCIINDYDELQQPRVLEDGFDFICYVGRGAKTAERVGVWEIRELPPPIEADREAWQPAAGAGS